MTISLGGSDLTVSTAALFWGWVNVDDDDVCWEWNRGKTGKGYGQFRLNGKQVGAHRVAWVLANGEIAGGLFVCHKCDNPACCNPSHLFLGTNRDNLRDAAKKGRAARGARNTNSKLTDKDVVAIRHAHARGATQVELAKQFGVSQPAVSCVTRRATWRHVET